MKKFVVLAMTLCMSFTLFACGKEEKRIDPEKAAEIKKEYVGDLLNEKGKKDLVYMCGDEESVNEFEYEYVLPKILIDSEDAAAANIDIAEKFEAQIKNILESEDRITDEDLVQTIQYEKTSYESYISDNVFCLVIKGSYYYEPTENYEIYCFDTKTGKRLENEDLLKTGDFSEEEFAAAYKRAALSLIDEYLVEASTPEGMTDEELAELSGRFLDIYTTNLHYREDSLETKDVSSYKLFLDDTGELNAIVNVAVGSGIGTSVEPMLLEKTNATKLEETTKAGVQFKYADGKATIKIQSNDKTKKMPKAKGFKFGKEYEIFGAYKNYLYAAIIDTDTTNYLGTLVLLSDDGLIAYLDIDNGVAAGSFTLTEPLFGCYNVDELSDTNLASIKAAIDESNNSNTCLYTYNCFGLYDELENFSVAVSKDTSAGQEEIDAGYDAGNGNVKDFYNIALRGANREIFEYQVNLSDGTAHDYTGSLRWVGFCDDGMVYTFALERIDTEPLPNIMRGAFAIKNISYYDEEKDYYHDAIELTYLSGEDLFDSGKGKVELSRTSG